MAFVLNLKYETVVSDVFLAGHNPIRDAAQTPSPHARSNRSLHRMGRGLG
jgi:hypothetical protein